MKTDIYRFCLNVMIFIPFMLLLYICFVILLSIFSPNPIFTFNLNYQKGDGPLGHMHTRLCELRNVRNVDILIIGSSHAFRGYDTRIFRKNYLTVFNLGSSAQTPIQTKVLLERYLDQLNPMLVILDVYPIMFCIDGVESSLDLLANDRNDLLSLKMALDLHNIKTYNTLIYGFMRNLLNLNPNYSEPKQKKGDTYISGGYVQKDIQYFKYVNYPNTVLHFNDKQFQYFEEILKILRHRKIQHILVYSPITSSKYFSYSNNEYFNDKMSNYGEYYNFNEILSLNDSLFFYDADHLNHDGVKMFNYILLDLLFKKLNK